MQNNLDVYRSAQTPCSPALSSLLKLADDIRIPETPSLDFEYYLEEKYCDAYTGWKQKIFYHVKPILPHSFQLGLRRRYAKIQRKLRFPAWPIESLLVRSADEYLLRILMENDQKPVHRIAPWPDGHTFAVALTHDVESGKGFRMVEQITELEKTYGYRSTWNVVPEGYHIKWGIIDKIRSEGFELGVHGLRHDGKLFDSYTMFQKQGVKIRKYAEEWNATGFRSPSTLRRTEWMHELGFEYDSSFTDSAPFEPQPGGCCSIWPYDISGCIEIPMTLPQDHTLFIVLDCRDIQIWKEKVDWIAMNGGIVVIDTHPDYMLDPTIFGFYKEFIQYISKKPGAWHAKMVDINRWWRQRSESHLVFRDGNYVIEGPSAKRGRIISTIVNNGCLQHEIV